jgi:hypothetical protein
MVRLGMYYLFEVKLLVTLCIQISDTFESFLYNIDTSFSPYNLSHACLYCMF